METFVDELNTKKVISKEDIILLKQYIWKKYSTYSKEQKSDILSKSIYQVISRSFGNLDKHYDTAVKQNLLKNTILKNGQSIMLSDILKVCMDKSDNYRDLPTLLLEWINLNIENKISEADLTKYAPSIYSELTTNDISNSNIIPEEVDISYTIDKNFQTTYNNKSRKIPLLVTAFFTCLLIGSSLVFFSIQNINKNNTMEVSLSRNVVKKQNTSNVTFYLNYKDINKSKLKSFLNSRNSLLAEEPYFSAIISVSKQYNLNPLILFAITGQEQSFVPKQNPNSKKIANNPFNIYHSWQEYNTNISDASKIAALTVINLSKDKPQNEEPFHWINRQYAEDPNWSKGVKSIYDSLEENDSSGN